jgi:L-fuconolactonase
MALVNPNKIVCPMKVDSHVHFWQYTEKEYDWISGDMQLLRRDYMPHDLLPALKQNELNACVAVQAHQSERETYRLAELAKTNDFIKGVVGWVDLLNESIEERLRYFSQYPVIKGWRHIVQGEPDDFLAKKDFRRGISMLQSYRYTYDILIYDRQLGPAIDFVTAFPEQKFIIDHCAKPDIASKSITEWKSLMREIAKHPNVSCKLSGLLTEAAWKRWTPADFYPYLDVVFEAFGHDRILFGSDWPVMLLSGTYSQWKSLLEKYMENLTEEEKEKIVGNNAVAFYGLT